MKVQIVIPVINLWQKYTRPALDSVFDAMLRAKSHDIDCQIILVDNASTDDTQHAAPLLNSELFVYHRNEERWGFQKSVNLGVNYGWEHGADFALVCNNDIVLHPEAIWRLVERMTKGDVGMATCMDISGEMRDKGIMPAMISRLLAQDKESIEDSPHPCFSAFMISRQCWDVIGELDEGFAPAYFEDNDYHYRMNVAEVIAITHPPAMFYHFASRTQKEANEKPMPMVSHGEFENNKAYMMKKWNSISAHDIKFTSPFNDPSLSIRYTKQNPH